MMYLPPTTNASTATPTPAEKTLLNPPSARESDLKAYIRTWLLELGIPPSAIWTEYRVASGGDADIYLTNRRVIIEGKRTGVLKHGPHVEGTGSRPGETAFEQIDRYVRDERNQDQWHIDDYYDDTDSKDGTTTTTAAATNEPWLGVVTDCRRWWVWTWKSSGVGGGVAAIRSEHTIQ